VVVGYQRWDDILFLHWPVPLDAVRARVDRRLEVDLFDGRAFVSLTPFSVRAARLRGTPRLPLVSDFHELNFRTYVRRGSGEPGVWFFSLDAASAVASALARVGLGLPYFVARMERGTDGPAREFRSRRVLTTRPVSFAARWTAGELVPDPPGSLTHFLVERYALYSTYAGRLLRVRVRHPPWVLRDARVERMDETLIDAAGMTAMSDRPLAHASAGVDVEFFPPELLA
jgi:uncharacterized protein YqjF (DUF2071 family)